MPYNFICQLYFKKARKEGQMGRAARDQINENVEMADVAKLTGRENRRAKA